MGLAEEAPARFRVAAAYGRRRAGVRLSSRPVEQRLAQLRSAGKLDPGLDPAVAAKAFEAMQIGVLDWWLGSAEPARHVVPPATTVSSGHPWPATPGQVSVGSHWNSPLGSLEPDRHT